MYENGISKESIRILFGDRPWTIDDSVNPVQAASSGNTQLESLLGPNSNQSVRTFDLRNQKFYNTPGTGHIYNELMKKDFWLQLCKEVVDMAKIEQSDIVADLGAGTGIATLLIYEKNPKKLYAVDISDEMLKYLRIELNKKGICADNKHYIVHGSIKELEDSRLERANKIISTGVLVIPNKPVEFLRSVYDYLPDGGIYIFTVEDWRDANVSGEPFEDFNKRLSNAIKQRTEQSNYLNDPVFSQATYKMEEVISMIGNAGGRIIDKSTKEMAQRGEDILKNTGSVDLPEDVEEIIMEFYSGKQVVSGVQHRLITTKR